MNDYLLDKEDKRSKSKNKSDNIKSTNKNKETISSNHSNLDNKSKNSRQKKPQENYYIQINNSNSHLKENENQYSNRIESSKYTWFNMIPKILLEQFSNVGNIYFLILAIIQLIPNISNSGSTPINFIPLTIVVVVNGLKDAVEDYKRKKADNAENNSKVKVLIYNNSKSENNNNKFSKKSKNKDLESELDPEGFIKTEWKRIKPGEIVKIHKNETFPADLLLIYSSNPKGAAYVETKSLDGETNLKLKESVKNVYDDINKIKSDKNKKEIKNFLKGISGKINCDNPNDKMYKFSGTLLLDDNKNSQIKYSKTLQSNSKDKNNGKLLSYIIFK